ncbi:MAG: AI-2E family transporter [Lachnospiraceae bacterium]|nr:AI-2E family transporter [Lachnospiraceae bacterium]
MEKSQIKKYCLIGVIAAAVCLFVMNVKVVIAAGTAVLSAAAPLLLGIVIAYILNILLKKIEKYYFPKTKNPRLIASRRPVSIILSFVALVVIITLLVNLVVPELMSTIRLMVKEIPPAAEAVRLWAIEHSGEIPAIQESLQNLDIDWEATIRKALEVLAAGAGGIFSSVMTVVGSLFGTVTQFVIGTIFAIYLLSSKEKLAEQGDHIMKAYLRPQTRTKILYVAGTVHETFSSFIVGQCMEAVIIGSLCAVGMLVLKMPYAVMTGTVVGVTALIPVVGACIGAVVGAFMVFTVNPLQALIFIVFLLILQQLEGNLIYPKVVGSSIGLPGMWVLAAVTIGGGVFGIGGMLLGVPLAASAYKLLEADVEKRIKMKK